MKEVAGIASAVAFIAITIFVGLYVTKSNIGSFEDKNLTKRGLDTPTIWIFIDSSEVNSRFWSDFGARSSRALNIPLLNLCYESIVKNSIPKYHVEVLSGLQGVAEKLGGWDEIPGPMRNKRLPLKMEEMMFIKTAILAKFGGLWLPISTVCLTQIPTLPADKVAFFGTDPTETYSGPDGTVIPNTSIMWAPKPETPIFVEWSESIFERIDSGQSGKQTRNDANWDWVYVTSTKKNDFLVFPHMELSRKDGGRRLELEDIFASGTEGNLPFSVPHDAVFLPIKWSELNERRTFGWVLRLSEQQVMESDIAIKYLL